MSLDTIQSTLAVLNADEVLKNLNEKMTTSFSTIDGYLAARENAKAQKLAVDLIHQVQIKSGFEFKTTLQKSFFTKTILPKYGQFPDLSKEQQQIIVKEISGYRQGLFIDMINLTKRIAVYKAKAELAMFWESGSLRKSARDKILADLALAAVSPIQIKDKNGTTLQIPSKYVIDSNYTFMFDYEIELFLVKNPQAEITMDEFEGEKKGVILDGVGVSTVHTANLCFQMGRTAQWLNFSEHWVGTKEQKEACSDAASRLEVIGALLNHYEDFDYCFRYRVGDDLEHEYTSSADMYESMSYAHSIGKYDRDEKLPFDKLKPIIYNSILSCAVEIRHKNNGN